MTRDVHWWQNTPPHFLQCYYVQVSKECGARTDGSHDDVREAKRARDRKSCHKWTPTRQARRVEVGGMRTRRTGTRVPSRASWGDGRQDVRWGGGWMGARDGLAWTKRLGRG